VQAELKHAAMDRSVAEVARRYGFTNPGRFTAAYRRRFWRDAHGDRQTRLTFLCLIYRCSACQQWAPTLRSFAVILRDRAVRE
jgi:hypothetical protein